VLDANGQCVHGWEFIFAVQAKQIGPGGLYRDATLKDIIMPVRAQLLEHRVLVAGDDSNQQFFMSYFGSGVWQISMAFLMSQYNSSMSGTGTNFDFIVRTDVGNEVFFTELPLSEQMPRQRSSHVAFQAQSTRFVSTKKSRGFQIVDSSYTPGKYTLVLDIGLHAPSGFVLVLKKHKSVLSGRDSVCETAASTAVDGDQCCHGYFAGQFVTTEHFYEQTLNCSTAETKEQIAAQNYVDGRLQGFRHSYAEARGGKITVHMTETDMFNVSMQQSRVGAIEILDLEIGFAFLTSDVTGNFEWSIVLASHRLEKTLYSTITSRVQSDSLLVVGRNVSLFRSFLREPVATLYDFADVHLYNLDANSTATYSIKASSVLAGIGTAENTTDMRHTCVDWANNVNSLFTAGALESHGDCKYSRNVCVSGYVRAGRGQGMIISLGQDALSHALKHSAFKNEDPQYLYLDFFVDGYVDEKFVQKRVRSQHLVTWQRTRVDCANEHELLGAVGVENMLGLYPNVSTNTNGSGFNRTQQVAPVTTLISTVLPAAFMQQGNEDYLVRLHRLSIVYVSSRIKQQKIHKLMETTGITRETKDLVFEFTEEMLELCPYWFVDIGAGSGCQTQVIVHNGVMDPRADVARELSIAPHAAGGTWNDLPPEFHEHAREVLESQRFDRRLRTAWIVSTKNSMNANMQLSSHREPDDIPSSTLMMFGSFRLYRESDECPSSDYKLQIAHDFPVGLLEIVHSGHIRTQIRRIYSDVLGLPLPCVTMDGVEACSVNNTQRACTTLHVRLPYENSNVSTFWSAQILDAATNSSSSFHGRVAYLTEAYLSDFVNDKRWGTNAEASLLHVHATGDETKPRNSVIFHATIHANDVPVSDQAVQFFAQNRTYGKNARMTAMQVAAPFSVLCGTVERQKQYIKEQIEAPLIFSSSNTLREIVVAHVGISDDVQAFCSSTRRLLQMNIFLLDSEIVFLPKNPDVAVLIMGSKILYEAGVRYLFSEATELLPAVDVFRGFGWLTDGSLIPPVPDIEPPFMVLAPKPLFWLQGLAWTGVVVHAILLLAYFAILSAMFHGNEVGIMDNSHFWHNLSNSIHAIPRQIVYQPMCVDNSGAPWPATEAQGAW
jgi:hypothetical protein